MLMLDKAPLLKGAQKGLLALQRPVETIQNAL